MKNKKAFTLIEMIIVIIIVGILATVLVPLLQGHVEDSKWSEGEAGMGTIATALRAYIVEHAAGPADDDFTAIGLTTGDLLGKYFSETEYGFTGAGVDALTGAPTYSITADAPWASPAIATKTLANTGILTP